jgi:hypothetical protein
MRLRSIAVDALVAVLDQRDHHATRSDYRNQALEQRRVAHARVSGDAENLHQDE